MLITNYHYHLIILVIYFHIPHTHIPLLNSLFELRSAYGLPAGHLFHTIQKQHNSCQWNPNKTIASTPACSFPSTFSFSFLWDSTDLGLGFGLST